MEVGIREICDKIFQMYGETFVKEAFSLLIVLFNNIISHPNEEKYRMFKKTNLNLKTKILIIKETLDLIKAIGYCDKDDELLQYTGDATALKQVTYVLNEYIQKINVKLAEKEKMEEIKRQDEIKRNLEAIEKKRKEKDFEEAKIRQQLANDRKEKAYDKATDSVSRDLGYGAKEMKFCPPEKKGG